MATGPIDYTRGFAAANPLGGVLEAMQAGATFAGIEQQRQMRDLQIAQQRQAQMRQAAIGEAMQALINNPNPTFADYQRVALLAPKEQSEQLLKGWEALSKERRENQLGQVGQVLAAARAGANDVAINLLREQAVAAQNSGQADQARAWGTWADLIERDPSGATATIGTLIAQLPGGDKVIESVGKVQEQRRLSELAGPQLRSAIAAADKAESDAKAAGVTAEFAPQVAQANLTTAQSNAVIAAQNANVAAEMARLGLDKARADVRNVLSTINDRAARLGLDRERLGLETARTLAEIQQRNADIPESARKGINDSAVAAAAAGQQARRLESLAADLAKAGGGFGALSTATEWLRRSTGNQNAMSELRQEYIRLRNTLAIQSLPPGPATDRDIQLALAGFPPETADSRTIASFLTGMAKMQKVTETVEKAKADWLANNRGSLGRASSTFQAGDFAARQGETFADFSTRIATQVTRSPMAAAVQQIPGQGPAAPAQAAPAAPSIRDQADAILRGGR